MLGGDDTSECKKTSCGHCPVLNNHGGKKRIFKVLDGHKYNSESTSLTLFIAMLENQCRKTIKWLIFLSLPGCGCPNRSRHIPKQYAESLQDRTGVGGL